MDAAEFLGVTPTHNPHRWYLPVTIGIATGDNFLFGGCALGAAIEALERMIAGDQLQVQRLKKRKLVLKDQIIRLEDQLTPDIIA